MTRWWLLGLALAVGVGFWLGRGGAEEVREALDPESPREAYERSLRDAGLDDAALGRLWVRAATYALAQAPRVDAPFRESGYLDPSRPDAVAYRFRARAGQRLTVRLQLDPPTNALYFMELFRTTPDPADPPDRIETADRAVRELVHEPRRDGDYIVRIQPELLRGGRYTLTVTTDPTLGFPVEGAGAGNVGSFFGDARDGGARDHHGIDIFAGRGTPVLAVTEGRVSRVRTTPRGGRVVWLRDERRGQSLYYAHLEEQLVENGALVRRGDTLGLVGNSGNARGTPPHLHFGVYRRGRGPMDPLPFVRPAAGGPPAPAVPSEGFGGWRRVAVEEAPLRDGPAEDARVVEALGRHVPVRIYAAAGPWHRVELPDGRRGFLDRSATEAVGPLRSESLEAAAPLRDSPGPDGAEIVTLAAGRDVAVLGRFRDHLLVAADGREAWIPARPAGP